MKTNEELAEAVDLLQFWTDMDADEYAAEDHDDPDLLARINAAFTVLKAVPGPEDYLAWLRWNGHTYVTCDSDDEGAFPVCRNPHYER